MEEQTLVIMDNCDDSIIGTLTVYGKDEESVAEEVKKVKDVFKEVMNKLPGEWSMEDLIDGLEEKGMNFSWTTDVEIMSI